MKPFNLEQALNGAPVITRNGLKIVQLFHATEIARCGERNNLLAVDERGRYDWLFPTGHFHEDQEESPADLFMAPYKHKGYIRLHEHPGKHVRLCSNIYLTKDEFDNSDYRGPIIEVEWEE